MLVGRRGALAFVREPSVLRERPVLREPSVLRIELVRRFLWLVLVWIVRLLRRLLVSSASQIP